MAGNTEGEDEVRLQNVVVRRIEGTGLRSAMGTIRSLDRFRGESRTKPRLSARHRRHRGLRYAF